MCSLGETIQRLLQALSRRFQYLLGLWILDITVLVELVATCAEHRRGKQFGGRCYEVCCEVLCGWRGEAKLASRRFWIRGRRVNNLDRVEYTDRLRKSAMGHLESMPHVRDEIHE